MSLVFKTLMVINNPVVYYEYWLSDPNEVFRILRKRIHLFQYLFSVLLKFQFIRITSGIWGMQYLIHRLRRNRCRSSYSSAMSKSVKKISASTKIALSLRLKYWRTGGSNIWNRKVCNKLKNGSITRQRFNNVQ
jgi:hypothetical protein